ncbi:putative alcohol dehydrogenase [Fonsecaea pedrosoi]|nr:putative alcohol dehydrogenase [Fonsecaea pedrosoi]
MSIRADSHSSHRCALVGVRSSRNHLAVMKAFQFDNVEEGLVLKDVPTPKPESGEVVVRVEAAGLCHSDTHVLHGKGASWTNKRPITLGHEAAGTVAGIGPGVTGWKVGDRVGVAVYPTDDGDSSHIIGIGRDGGYAEQVVVPANVLVRLPDAVSFAQAAVATDSIATAYHAVISEGEVTASTTVAIVGMGGLGLNGVRVAALQGATVYGVDIDENKFPEGLAQGAKACFSKLSDIPEDVVIDVVVDYAGMGVTTQEAMQRVKLSGTVVLVGIGVASFEFSSLTLLLRGLTIRGSKGATLPEYLEILKLIAAGKIVPKLTEVPFSTVPESLKRLEQVRGVVGRLYTRPNA